MYVRIENEVRFLVIVFGLVCRSGVRCVGVGSLVC